MDPLFRKGGVFVALRSVLSVYAAILSFPVWSDEAVTVGSIAPKFDFYSLDETEKLVLESYRGEWVYVDFWASWCPPCAKSFPWMNELSNDVDLSEVNIVAISVDREKKSMKKFVERFSPLFPVAWDPEGKIATLYNVPAMPTSYLVGPDGVVRLVHLGFRENDGKNLHEQIRRIILREGA